MSARLPLPPLFRDPAMHRLRVAIRVYFPLARAGRPHVRYADGALFRHTACSHTVTLMPDRLATRDRTVLTAWSLVDGEVRPPLPALPHDVTPHTASNASEHSRARRAEPTAGDHEIT